MIDKYGHYYLIDHNALYRLEKLTFVKFRNLDGMEIDFGKLPITGIFGANGMGKSTILSTIRCLYQSVYNPRSKRGKPRKTPYFHRPAECRNEPFGHLFPGNQFFNYIGSSIAVDFSAPSKNASGLYQIQAGMKRWSPGTTAKPVRPVYYIEMESCIPAAESGYTKAARDKRAKIYRSIMSHSDALRADFNYIFTRDISISDLSETGRGIDEQVGIAMSGRKMLFRDLSAGEQRVLKLLDIIYNAPDGSLILIDEIELTLHKYALHNLLDVLVRMAFKRNLQIVFTSHNQSLLHRRDINIRSLYKEGDSIKCDHGYNQDCIALLEGPDAPRYATILVEDMMSQAIVMELLNQKGKLPLASIISFGGYHDAFKLASSLYLTEKLSDKIMFVLDGDVCKTRAEKEEELQLAKVIPDLTQEMKDQILSHFTEYILPGGTTIEPMLFDLIKRGQDIADPVVVAANKVPILTMETVPFHIADKKRYLEHYMIPTTISNLGYRGNSMILGYSAIVHHFATNYSKKWRAMTFKLSQWIDDNLC